MPTAPTRTATQPMADTVKRMPAAVNDGEGEGGPSPGEEGALGL